MKVALLCWMAGLGVGLADSYRWVAFRGEPNGDFTDANHWFLEGAGKTPSGPPSAGDDVSMGNGIVSVSGGSVRSLRSGFGSTFQLSGAFSVEELDADFTLTGIGILSAKKAMNTPLVAGAKLVIDEIFADDLPLKVSQGGSITLKSGAQSPSPNVAVGLLADGGSSVDIQGTAQDLGGVIRSQSQVRIFAVDNKVPDTSLALEDAGTRLRVDGRCSVVGGFLDMKGGAKLVVGDALHFDGGMDSSGKPLAAASAWLDAGTEVTASVCRVGLRQGAYTLTLRQQTQASGDLLLGVDSGSDGAVLLDDQGTSWTTGQAGLIVGAGGKGRLSLAKAATCKVPQGAVAVGFTGGANGRLVMRDAGTALDARGAPVSIGRERGSQGNVDVFDKAVLLLGGELTIGVNQGQGGLQVNGGTVHQNAASAVSVGVGGGTGTISVLSPGGALTLSQKGSALSLGESPGGQGTMTVSAGGVVNLAGDFFVGRGGTGTARITGPTDGGIVTQSNPDGRAGIGVQAGSVGTLGVFDSKSRLVLGTTIVGVEGTGTITLDRGATAETEIMQLGEGKTGVGSVTVAGGSRWNNRTSLIVGGRTGGKGTLGLRDNAEFRVGTTIDPTGRRRGCEVLPTGLITLEATSKMAVGTGAFGPPGTLRVSANGILLGTGRVRGQVIIGLGGKLGPGASPGTLTVEGDFTEQEGGELEIEIGGSNLGVDSDLLKVDGQANLGGTLRVHLLRGYAPGVSESFRVLEAKSLVGKFARVLGAEIEYTANGFSVRPKPNAAAAPRITRYSREAGIEWIGQATQFYRVERSLNLQGEWAPVSPKLQATATPNRFLDPNPPIGQAFYRAVWLEGEDQ